MPRKVEFWSNLTTADTGSLEAVGKRAARLEADGWDGATLVDSQCLRADVFVSLACCAQATSRLKLGTGTSNPVTRHPSVLASAAAALQILSKGRMTLGIGRGDSSLAYIGASPVSVALFEKTLEMIQAYLRGEPVSIDDAALALPGGSAGFEKLAVAAAPESSRLKWLAKDTEKTPVEAACTGPKVIAAAARHADYIAFGVGADPARLKWGMGVAREAMERAGRDPAEARFSAFLPLYPHRDVEVSRQLSQGMVASQGRFSIINKKISGPVTEAQAATLERVAKAYDMTSHGSAASAQSKALDTQFIDEFALGGDPTHCLERLEEIIGLGLDKLHLWTASTESEKGAESYQLVADEILPKLQKV